MSYRIYDISAPGYDYSAYTVKINGKAVALDSARVSAMPFNRRWPGHERTEDQTELANFLSLATDEPLEFEITPHRAFEQVEIRPRSLGIVPEVRDGVIRFTLPRAAYFTVEPFGRHDPLHVFADPMPQYDAIDPEDDSVIYFGKGVHDVGMIQIQAGQTLFLDEGAVVYACVRAKDADHIRILGRGILDNSKNLAEILYPVNAEHNDAAINNAIRKNAIEIEYCDDVKIEGITIRDSAVYNIRPVCCRGVDISNVKIIGSWRYNSDGIDMHNCEDVVIDNCFIRTFDDSICVKGFDFYCAGDELEQMLHDATYHNGQCYDVFRNAVIRNCVIWNDWGRCLEIGAETRAREICDIVFENCDIIHVTMDVLDCQNVDYADVHDLVWRNINVEYDEEIPEPVLQRTDRQTYEIQDRDFAPALLCAVVIYHPEYSAGSVNRGKNRNILFEDIYLYGRQTPIFHFEGFSEDAATENVVIRNFWQNGKKLRKSDLYRLECNEYCRGIDLQLED